MKRIKNLTNLLNKKDAEKAEKLWLFKPERPTIECNFNDFNIPSSRQVNKTKEFLSKVLAFIDMVKYHRFASGLTVMSISTTNKRLLSMCSSSMGIHNFIKKMIDIGLLSNYSNNYQFNAYYSKDNHCKQYCYNYETELLIKDYCKENKINMYRIRNIKRYKGDKIVDSLDAFDNKQVKVSSKLNFLKPDNWSTTDFEDYLTQVLYENYPQLEAYQKKADIINEVFYDEDVDRQIQFRPSFGWSKGNKCVRKIGLRATNSLVASKKNKEEGDADNILYREDILKRYELNYEYDVKSSVPRVTYLLNKGQWLNENTDLYEVMFNKFIQKCPEETDEWNKETRDAFKSLHMRGYFDTENMIGAHIKREISKKVEHYNRDDWTWVDSLMRSYKRAIDETVGGLDYDSEIFLHESCIYIDVLFELLKRGYKVFQVYDGFYTDREVPDFQEIVAEKAYAYYEKYIAYEEDSGEIKHIEPTRYIQTITTTSDVVVKKQQLRRKTE